MSEKERFYADTPIDIPFDARKVHIALDPPGGVCRVWEVYTNLAIPGRISVNGLTTAARGTARR